MLGGATGTGKSSLATELAYRLGISRITSTDVVRQVMRAFFAPGLMPALHYSSFEAGEGLRMPMPDPDDDDRALYGFIQQAEQVAVGAAAVVERAVQEGLSTVLEGVHLVPGLVECREQHSATVVQVLLTIQRRGGAPGALRGAGLQLGRCEGARPLPPPFRRDPPHPGLSRGPRGAGGVPIVDGLDGDDALRAVLDLILERAAAAAGAVP